MLLGVFSTHKHIHIHTHNQRGTRKLLEAMAMFITLIVMMVTLTRVFTYVQTHKIISINSVQFLYTNYTSIKLGKNLVYTYNGILFNLKKKKSYHLQQHG